MSLEGPYTVYAVYLGPVYRFV